MKWSLNEFLDLEDEHNKKYKYTAINASQRLVIKGSKQIAPEDWLKYKIYFLSHFHKNVCLTFSFPVYVTFYFSKLLLGFLKEGSSSSF